MTRRGANVRTMRDATQRSASNRAVRAGAEDRGMLLVAREDAAPEARRTLGWTGLMCTEFGVDACGRDAEAAKPPERRRLNDANIIQTHVTRLLSSAPPLRLGNTIRLRHLSYCRPRRGHISRLTGRTGVRRAYWLPARFAAESVSQERTDHGQIDDVRFLIWFGSGIA
jgi:hypothetical protein